MQKYNAWCAITHGHALMPTKDGLFYKVEDVDPRIAKLESLLRRVNEWTPGLPAEASLQCEIAEALGLPETESGDT